MSKSRSIFLALLTMLLWGTLFPTVKLGFAVYEVRGLADILLFAGIRFTVCGAVISLLAACKNKNSFKTVGTSILPILLSGAFAIILHYTFTYSALELTTSSKTALLKQLGALFYVCFSFIFIKADKPTVQKIVGALIGFGGIVAMNVTTDGLTFTLGDVLILGASFCTVFSNVINKKVFVRVEPLTAAGISQLFGGAVLLIAGAFMGGSVNFRADASIAIMLYICAASIVSYCLWYMILKYGELSKLFIIKFAEPLFACVFGAILLDEDIFQIRYLLAFLLISGGILLSNTKCKKRKQKQF